MNIHRIYGLLLPRFRRRRMELFARWFPGPGLRVLDVGGTAFNWAFLERPQRVSLVNVLPYRPGPGVTLPFAFADGRELPFADGEFDVVFSNSVIEHVGTRAAQERFAAECRRVGRGYFVQTPDRRFPVEPHLLTPFVHWLPRGLQGRLIRNFTVRGLLSRPSREWCARFMEDVHLLGAREMHQLFPDGELVVERFLGLSKSLIAVKPLDGPRGDGRAARGGEPA
ncbi:MAG: methyltransferase domain-containing protein [Thermoanaerobaculia bacterium]|nr:methyltransferase domain-containing protein [Thermoanaerobaculia bacterium]